MNFRKILFSFLLLLLLPVATMVVLEIVLRVFDPIGVQYYYDVAPYFRIMEPDPDFAYRHRPGFSGALQGVEFRINSEGLRWREFDIEKKECTVRVLVLGDSMVLGWGVRQEDIFPAKLQELFDETGAQVEVISAGVGSWNTRTEYEFLAKRGLDYKPDILVLLVEPGDVEPKANGKTYVTREVLFGSHSYLKRNDKSVRILELLEKPAGVSYLAMTAWHFARTGKRKDWRVSMYDEDAPTWLDTKAAIIETIRVCRENKVNPIVYLWGSPGHSEYTAACHRTYGKMFERNRIPCATFPDSLYQREYANSLVDTHPNAAGHGIMANVIFKDIGEKTKAFRPECNTAGSNYRNSGSGLVED